MTAALKKKDLAAAQSAYTTSLATLDEYLSLVELPVAAEL
jgi:hypothetical protein